MTTRSLLVFIACAVAAASSGGEQTHAYKHLVDFSVPSEFLSEVRFHPVDYLRTFPIPDSRAALQPDQRRRLERLFVAAYDACVAKYGQDYLLPPDSPVYQLLRNNNPRIRALRPLENGRLVFLRSIAEAVRPDCCSTEPLHVTPPPASSVPHPSARDRKRDGAKDQ